MYKTLVLEEITADEGLRVIGELSKEETILGRETDSDGLTIPNSAISREHAAILHIRNHWFFKDLGSTNGSWHNGIQVKTDKIRLIRPGDTVQLADTPLRISVAEGNAGNQSFLPFSNSTLIVFSNGSFHDEFPLPEYGRALVVGGSQADLKLDNSDSDVPRMVVERRGERVFAYGISEGLDLLLNGELVKETVNLKDGDELCIADYVILFNDPRPSVQPNAEVGAEDQGTYAAYKSIRSWDDDSVRDRSGLVDVDESRHSEQTPSGKFLFGKKLAGIEDQENTVALDPQELEDRLSGYDTRPSSRHLGSVIPPGGLGMASSEDRLIIAVLFILLLALIGVIIWFLLV